MHTIPQAQRPGMNRDFDLECGFCIKCDNILPIIMVDISRIDWTRSHYKSECMSILKMRVEKSWYMYDLDSYFITNSLLEKLHRRCFLILQTIKLPWRWLFVHLLKSYMREKWKKSTFISLYKEVRTLDLNTSVESLFNNF